MSVFAPRSGSESAALPSLRERLWTLTVVIPLPRLARRLPLVAAAAVAALVVGLGLSGTGYRYDSFRPEMPRSAAPEPGDAPTALAALDGARAERAKLEKALKRAAPRGRYIVIDRTNNRLSLMEDGQARIEAVCSAGSGTTLVDARGNRSWTFDTPQGEFKVISKTRDPVWRKPDWAFVEEGEPLPKRPGDRIEYGTLGEYALHFGNGYMIHGTLYERLLGRSVTHGCIRLGREDLQRLFDSAPVGTPILIY